MSLPKDLKELQDKRAKLEDESNSLKDEQKKLEERAKTLEEKIIEKLKNSNKATRQAISQLETKISELEQKLNQASPESQQSETGQETRSKSYLKKCVECEKEIPIASEECQYCGAKQIDNTEQVDETASEELETVQEETADESVTIGTLEDSTRATQEEIGQTLSKLNGKRKDGFFQSLFK
jgi:chromosome segregation ATPase